MPETLAPSLPIVPALPEGESFRSFIGRLADANLIQRCFRPFMSGLRSTTEALAQASSWASLDPEILARRISAIEIEGHSRIRLGSSLLAPGRVHQEGRQVCPQCMAEGPAAPCIWDLKGYTVCSRHGVRLVQRCDGCDHRLTWHSTPRERCRCGKPFADLLSLPGKHRESKISARLARAVDVSLAQAACGESGLAVGAVLIGHDVLGHHLLERMAQESDNQERSAVRQSRWRLLLTALYDDAYVQTLWDELVAQFEGDTTRAQVALLVGQPSKKHFQTVIPHPERLPLPPTPWRSPIPLHLRTGGSRRRRFVQQRNARQITREIGDAFLKATASGWHVPLDHIAGYRVQR